MTVKNPLTTAERATIDRNEPVLGKNPPGIALGAILDRFVVDINASLVDVADDSAIHDDEPGEILAITLKGTPVSADVLLIEDSADSNNKKRITVGSLPTGGGGEANSVSNVNTAGVGVFKQKTGVDLEFRGVKAASAKATVVLDAGTNEIRVDVADASATQAGAVELATQGEVDAGADTTRAIVPDTLANSTLAADVATNTAKVTNATHTGDVTGATALTITADAVANAMLADVATATIKGRVTALTGDPEDLTTTQVRTLINVEDGATADQTAGEIEAIVSHDNLVDYVVGQHRVIDDGGTGTTDLWSADKISTELAAATGGLDFKDAVETVADTNITLSGEQTLNGLLTSTSRVGVVGQTDASENGIYVTAAGAWARSADADEDGDVTQGMTFFVSDSGSTKTGFQYLLTTPDPIVVDTTDLSFTEIKRIELGTTAGTATEGNDSRVPTQDENDALVGTGAPSSSNVFVTDDDSRLTDDRTPTVHALGGAEHSADTLANLNAKISDATLIDTGDSRLSDERTPLDDSATNAKLANMAQATIKGRASGAGTGDPTDLTDAQLRTILNVADGANNYTHPNHTGDVTSTGDGAQTIVNDVVSNAKLANVATATIKGRVTAATGDPEDLTGTQATTLLDEFTTTLKGVVPGSGGGTANFLRADGTWVAPPGGGTDELVGVSANDTTPGYLLGKLTTATTGVAWAEINDAGDEDLRLDVDSASTGGQGLIELATQIEVDTGTDTTRALVPATLAGSALATNVATNNAKVSNATHTGDVTGSGALTIAANAVTLAKMATVATARFLGRVTTGVGDPEAITGTQATTLLDQFTSVLKGLVPASGGGTANFLRADGTWVAPTGGGSPTGAAGGDLAGTYPGPSVAAITTTTGPTSMVVGAIADGEVLRRSGATVIGYAPIVACCPFGGKSDDTGKFLIANGKSSDADDGTKAKTRQPIAHDGTLTRLAYKTKDGTTSTVMKIHINGSVEATVTLASMNANQGGVETISVAVVAGDYVEIEYDASDKPGECTMYFLQELPL